MHILFVVKHIAIVLKYKIRQCMNVINHCLVGFERCEK